MRTSSQVGYFVSGLAAIALLTTVQVDSANPTMNASTRLPKNATIRFPHVPLPQIAPVARKQFVDVARVNAAGGNATITSDTATNLVLVFGGDGRLNALLTLGLQSPQGITTDAAQSLYVANTGAQNVVVFEKPYTSITRTLQDADEYPVDVAVSKSGLVGVTNIFEPTGGFGGVTFYAKGSSTPCANVEDPFWQYLYFDSFDASGNLFVNGVDPVGRPTLGEISGGCNARTIRPLTTQNQLISPGGIQVKDGRILILDQASRAIYTYNPPVNGSLGAPIATTKVSETSHPTSIAMMAHEDNAWVVDAAFGFPVDEYRYPGGALLRRAFAQVALAGIAVNPAASP